MQVGTFAVHLFTQQHLPLVVFLPDGLSLFSKHDYLSSTLWRDVECQHLLLHAYAQVGQHILQAFKHLGGSALAFVKVQGYQACGVHELLMSGTYEMCFYPSPELLRGFLFFLLVGNHGYLLQFEYSLIGHLVHVGEVLVPIHRPMYHHGMQMLLGFLGRSTVAIGLYKLLLHFRAENLLVLLWCQHLGDVVMSLFDMIYKLYACVRMTLFCQFVPFHSIASFYGSLDGFADRIFYLVPN